MTNLRLKIIVGDTFKININNKKAYSYGLYTNRERGIYQQNLKKKLFHSLLNYSILKLAVVLTCAKKMFSELVY